MIATFLTQYQDLIVGVVLSLILLLWKQQVIGLLVWFGAVMSDDGRPSSKRVCAILVTITLCHVCEKYYNQINPWILVTLAVVNFLCLGLATFPQILDGIASIKGNINNQKPNS